MPKKGSPSGDSREGVENEELVLPGDWDEKEASKLGSLSEPNHIGSDEDDDISELESELEAPGEAALEDADEDGCIRTRILPLSEGVASNEMSRPPRPSTLSRSALANSSLRVGAIIGEVAESQS